MINVSQVPPSTINSDVFPTTIKMEVHRLVGFNKKSFKQFMSERNSPYTRLQNKFKKLYVEFGLKVHRMFDKYEFNPYDYTSEPVKSQTTTIHFCNDCALNHQYLIKSIDRNEELQKEINQLKKTIGNLKQHIDEEDLDMIEESDELCPYKYNLTDLVKCVDNKELLD